MWRLVKKYEKRYRKKKSFSLVTKAEIFNNQINYYAVLFYPDCQDGSKREIINMMVNKGNWIRYGEVLIDKTKREIIGKENIKVRELIDTIIYIDAYWQTLNFWTRGDSKQDIPLSIKHLLFLVEKLSLVLSDNVPYLETNEIIRIVSFLEDFGFKKSRHGQW